MLTVFTFICIYTIYSVSRKLGYNGWEFFIPGFNIYKAVELATGNGWLCLIFLVVLIPFVGWIGALVLFIIWWLKISGIIAQKYNCRKVCVFFFASFYLAYQSFKDAPNCDDPFNRFITRLFTLNKKGEAEEKVVLPEI